MIWPIHPHPLQDEILSSWMIRIAHQNLFKVHDFYAHYFGREKSIWNRDIDHFAPDWLIDGLVLHSGLDRKRVLQTSLRCYEGKLFESFYGNTYPHALIKGLLPVGIYHRLRVKNGLQFCPLCLADNEEPYFRKTWRVAYILGCPIHQIKLHDHCQHCGSSVAPHRVDMQLKRRLDPHFGIGNCSNCLRLLSEHSTEELSPNMAFLNSLIDRALSNDFVEVGSQAIYSKLFLDGLRTILQGYIRTMKDTPHRISNQNGFEILKLHDRYAVAEGCASFIKNWPLEFVEFSKSIPHPYTTFVSRNTSQGDAPFWVFRVYRDFF